MSLLKSYQLFEKINNRGSVSLSEREFDITRKSHCKNWTKSKTTLYRGQIDLGDYVYIDPQLTHRKSIDDINIHIELLSNLSSWRNWPKYSSSVIGVSGDSSEAKGYGKVYEVIPFDNSEIVVCPKVTIWDSFGGFGDDDSIYMTKYFLESLEINTNLWIQSDNKPLESHLKSIKNIKEYSSKIKDVSAIKKGLTQSPKERIDYFLEKSSEFLKKDINEISGTDCFNYINNYLFNPNINGFKKYKYSSGFSIPTGKQIWTSDPVLLISLSKA